MEIILVKTPNKHALYINRYKEMEKEYLFLDEVLSYLTAYSRMEGAEDFTFENYYVDEYSFPDEFDFDELLDAGDLYDTETE